jgi:hypothetical protein
VSTLRAKSSVRLPGYSRSAIIHVGSCTDYSRGAVLEDKFSNALIIEKPPDADEAFGVLVGMIGTNQMA